MIKERTKFNNSYDRNDYMNKMFHEFLDIHSGDFEKRSVKKINIEILRDINEYKEHYIYFQRITTIICAFLKQIEEIDKNTLSKLLQLKHSVKKQYTMVSFAKDIIKVTSFDSKYEIPIKSVITSVNKRLDYLLNLVATAYIEMTPLVNYKNKLEENGKSFYDEIINEFPLEENIGYDEDNELLQNYIKKILSISSDSEDWKKELGRYQKWILDKQNLIEKGRAEEKLKKKKQLKELAEKHLRKECDDIRNRYDTVLLSDFRDPLRNLANRADTFRRNGRLENKIVLLAKTNKGYNAATYYYSEKSKDYMTSGLSNCTILGEFDELPNEIMQKVDNCDLAMVEMLI